MKPVVSEMQFIGYRVTDARFKTIDCKIDDNEEIELSPKLWCEVETLKDDRHVLTLGVEIGSENTESKLPFYARLEMQGMFIIPKDMNSDLLLRQNGAAIMFPYLRSSLTMLTTLANVSPVVLPTLNIAAMFRNEDPACTK